jgi:hypothetical protein
MYYICQIKNVKNITHYKDSDLGKRTSCKMFDTISGNYDNLTVSFLFWNRYQMA